ncbi:RNA-binding NOB1-like protein [Impatiens glandulifera]|uniref:RNA-binding NOB1-like protein n=1 Tax=Impatiens glandulifera TaxID=253017 RepID=UPI001FB19CBC|nr:RNA-binding NOB1-like protein [Impatiens glandulifera]
MAASQEPPCWSAIVKQKETPCEQNKNNEPDRTATDRVFVESCKSSKGIAIAVVDANAIIQGGDKLSSFSDKFISVPEVINEVRDPTSRHRLNFLPFTVETREPLPEALKKVISFAKATGDLQTLSDVDIKLIALTYTMELQIHGAKHLRDSPPPIKTVNVKRLPEADMPGWGSNVPNSEEWEALEHEADNPTDPNSKILPLKDLNLNMILDQPQHDFDEKKAGPQESVDSFVRPITYSPKKKDIKTEGKIVAQGVDASQGECDDNVDDWLPAVSRSTHRRFLRRKARRELSEKDNRHDSVEGKSGTVETIIKEEDLSTILNDMKLEEEDEVLESIEGEGEEEEEQVTCFDDSMEETTSDINSNLEEYEASLEQPEEILSQTNESEQSWMLKSLSESSVACITSDFAMQNVLLQMGLRLLAPGGMQIRQLHRWILKCHACFKVTTQIGKIFCPSCGNGGTLRKVAVTVGENGIVLAARKPRVFLRGTKFSLPLPQGGRASITKNPVLREDQLPHKILYPKNKKNKQEDDIFLGDGMFLHHNDKKAPLQPPVRKAMAVFSGKRNPNDNHYNRTKNH